MKFFVLTAFPEIVNLPLEHSIGVDIPEEYRSAAEAGVNRVLIPG